MNDTRNVTGVCINCFDGTQVRISADEEIFLLEPTTDGSIHRRRIPIPLLPELMLRSDVAIEHEIEAEWEEAGQDDLEPWQEQEHYKPVAVRTTAWLYSRGVWEVLLMYDEDVRPGASRL